MAKRLKFKNVDELVDALNAWIALKPNELVFGPSVRTYVTGTTADSKSARRFLRPENKSLQVLSFRKEESKFNLIAVVKHEDIAILMQRRMIEKYVPDMVRALDQFAVEQGFESLQEMETKVRAAHRRNLGKVEVAKSKEQVAVKSAIALEQHEAYGSW